METQKMIEGPIPLSKLQRVYENFIIEHAFYSPEGYFCFILFHGGLAHRCGYVGVPPDHVLYEAEYEDARTHGGITYAGGFHKSAVGKDEAFWFFGFDCGHWNDLPDKKSAERYAELYKEFTAPHVGSYKVDGEASVKSLTYVRVRVLELSEQLTPHALMERRLLISSGED